LAQLSFTCRAVFLENNSMSNFISGERAMFWQLHHVLNSVRVSFQRSWPKSWLFGYWSCEADREAVPNGPLLSREKKPWKLANWNILVQLYSYLREVKTERKAWCSEDGCEPEVIVFAKEEV
jgi:hypothetical protein